MSAATTTAFDVPPAIRLVGTPVHERDCWVDEGDTLANDVPEPLLFVL
jgi:hypothetical protein